MNKLRGEYCKKKGFNFIDFDSIIEAEEYILYLEDFILSKGKINLKNEMKKYIENNNGKGSYDVYVGSLLESDIVEFIKDNIL